TTHHPPSTIHHPPSTIHHPPSTIHQLPTAMRTSLFSAKTEYACIAMLELAAQYGDTQPLRLKSIADAHEIPERFLVQIMLQLKVAGLVVSTRGAAGGYVLAKSPDQ